MTLSIAPLTGIPEIAAGDDLADIITIALQANGLSLTDGDVLVVSSKIASKSMGLTEPAGTPADKEALVLRESTRVVAERAISTGATRIVAAAAGPVMAAAGIDASNTGAQDLLLVLPHDPDAVCRDLAEALSRATGVQRIAVVLSDTAGRPWRVGQVDFALGCHGLLPLEDLRGQVDVDGREMSVTARCIADEVAAAADLVKGKVFAVPVALVRGLGPDLVTGGTGVTAAGDPIDQPGQDGVVPPRRTGARSLVRTGRDDWFGLGRVEAVRAALGVEPGSSLSAGIGITPAALVPLTERAARAVRLALAAETWHETGTSIDLGPGGATGDAPGESPVTATVSGPDPVAVGRIAARLEVALTGDGLAATWTTTGPDTVTIAITDPNCA